jgi:hypothetical protein
MWRGVDEERWRSLANPTALADLGLVEPRAFREDFDGFVSNPEAHPDGWMRLWPVLASEAFVRGHCDLPGRFEAVA